MLSGGASEVSLKTLRRRLVTIPATFVLAFLVVGLLPLWLAIALAIDVVRKVRQGIPFAVSRLVAFGAVYLLGQVIGVLSLGISWLLAGVGSARKRRLLAFTYAIQRAWVGTLLASVKRLYGVRIVLDGEDTLGPTLRGPLVVLMQHTSLVDTLLPTTYLTARRGLKLRWVLKKELLVDPSLDIAGLRLPNAFVGRDGSDTDKALAMVRRLATDLPHDEGVLIYPEGTRFTPGKRLRALERLASTPDLQARAARLKRVLPPRLGGPIALLETATQADVLFIAHVGFEGLSSVGAVLSGDLVGRTIRLHLRRIPRLQVPTDRTALVEWLWTQWEVLDAWVDAQAVAHESGVTGVARLAVGDRA
jgi:1-acyl-sn-glycerol-3-phosphate acyltransferase